MINTVVANLVTSFPDEIERPSRGLYVPRTPVTAPVGTPVAPQTPNLHEEEYYPAVAQYLMNDLEEATKAIEVGGGAFMQKWGTPDVVGLYKAKHGSLLPFETEVVTVEVKVDPAANATITAFGQAAAYRLFSHKVYLFLPETMLEEHASRIESLCLLFGIGLVLFTPGTLSPKFTIRVRAQRHSPDPYYLNEFAEKLRDAYPKAYKNLFE